MPATSFHSEARSLSPTAHVALYQLDTTVMGGPIYRFSPSVDTGQTVSFGGIVFTGVPVEITGMEISGNGAIQTPRMSIGNTDGFIQAAVNSFGNLEGARLTRWRTFARFLDGGAAPDATAFYGPDVYIIDRKSADTPEKIEWELRAVVDQQGMYIGRTIIRDTCMWRYRVWDGATGTWDYSKAQCPYTGSSYFNEQNVAVQNASEDVPARNLDCCRKRFGEKAVLPFGGFPGIVRAI